MRDGSDTNNDEPGEEVQRRRGDQPAGRACSWVPSAVGWSRSGWKRAGAAQLFDGDEGGDLDDAG
jgi:hypothetical protein